MNISCATSYLSKVSRIYRFTDIPIIIGGCGRSGTTLLLSILSCHPHIFAINDETRTFCRKAYAHPPDLAAKFKFKRLYEALYSARIPGTTTRWCEKTPKNVMVFGRILRHFGRNVRILNVVRDGRDVVTSRHPSRPEKFWVTPERWVTDVGAGAGFDDHPQVKTIRYEDLVLKFERTIRSIFRFINEDFVKELLAFNRVAPISENPAWFDSVKPLHRGSIGRWKEGRYKGLVDSLLARRGARPLLARYGYLKD